jgi:hypothetical protein
MTVIGGMMGEPSAFAPDVDGAIQAVASEGASQFASTPEQRAERTAALRARDVESVTAEPKPRPTREQVLAKLERKLESLPEEQRLDHATDSKWSDEARALWEEAYQNVAIGASPPDESYMLEEDVSDLVDGYDDDEGYADLLGSFRDDEEAA